MKALIIPLCVCSMLISSRAQKFGPNWERGFSDQYRAENTLGQYAFGYNEDHTSGGSFRRETGDIYGNKVGSYGLRISDGRIRIVNYVADHNGYRADVMTNEPGMSTQNSNGYVEVTKKGFRGIMVPGFRNSAEAPHITFRGSGSDKRRIDFNQGSIKEQQANFHQGNMNEQQPNFHQGNMKEKQPNFHQGNMKVQQPNFNREDINEQHAKLNQGDKQANYNYGNMEEAQANVHDNINEKSAHFNYDDINEYHSNSNLGDNEDQAIFNRGSFKSSSINNQQLGFGKDHASFTKNNKDETVVIPQTNGVTWEDSNKEFHSGLGEENFYAPNVVFDVAESNVIEGVKKDLDEQKKSSFAEQEQSSTVESTDHPTESRVTESVIKVPLDLYGNVTNTEKS